MKKSYESFRHSFSFEEALAHTPCASVGAMMETYDVSVSAPWAEAVLVTLTPREGVTEDDPILGAGWDTVEEEFLGAVAEVNAER